MSIPLFHIDAFTNMPFGGNPAAVCLLHKPAKTEWMQQVAAETNLSETAFLLRQGDPYQLRWFTPTTEADLCGHATLAATHALCEMGHIGDKKQVKFSTRSGFLTAVCADNTIELNFPTEPAEAQPEYPQELLEALLVSPTFVGKNRMDYLIEVASQSIVEDLAPNFAKLREINMRGVIVTAPSASPKCDFVSRFFAPGAGINEDPVTGSAHCCLGPYWGQKLKKETLVAHQISKRKGELFLRLADDRIFMRGQAVTILKGELCTRPIYSVEEP